MAWSVWSHHERVPVLMSHPGLVRPRDWRQAVIGLRGLPITWLVGQY